MASKFALIAALLFAGVQGHMELSYPAPFRSKFNPHANPGTVDYSMTAPLTGGLPFPCKGYQVDAAATTGVGTPTASWAQGGSANFTITGGANHNGGSCQVSLSYDQGKSFNVIHSFIGGCGFAKSYDFKIPADAPTGTTMMAWTWYNEVGNREMYMNCANVDITAASAAAPAVAFKARPDMFLANLNNGCTSVAGTGLDVNFPCPGNDITGSTTATGTITGTCQAVAGVGGEKTCAVNSSASSGSSGSSSGGSSVVSGGSSVVSAGSSATATLAASSAILTTLATSVSVSVASTTSTADACGGSAMASATGASQAASSTGTSTSLVVTTKGECGPTVGQTCIGSTIYGNCCSSFGYCGSTTAHCGSGCQSAYGTCGANGTTSTAKARRALRKALY